MAPGSDVSIDSFLAGVAQRSGLLATEKSVEAKRHRFLKELDCIEMKNEKWKKLIIKKDAAMQAMTTCLVGIKNAAKMKAAQGLLAKSNAEILIFAAR